MNNEIAHHHISTSAEFITYLSALFELRNANFLLILSPYVTFHCKLVPSYHRAIVLSLNRTYFWFACNERDFSEWTQCLLGCKGFRVTFQ